jgi:hypothetical protein
MKKIVINQKNSQPLFLEDDSTEEINSYTKEISKVMESSKICIIETSFGNAIIRPSEINSIFVMEIEDSKQIKNEKKIFDSRDVLKD